MRVRCLAVLSLCTVGCGSATPSVATSTPSAADDASHHEGPAASQDAAKRLTTADGWVSVTVPNGQGWRCVDDHVEANDVVASFIRCEGEANGAPIYLMAKDYTVPPADVTPAEQLFSLYYENNYRKMFERFEYVSKGPSAQGGYEVLLDGEHAELGPVRMRERATVAGTHVLLLTTQCSRDAYDAVKADIDRWFADARFLVLEPSVATR